jgi:serine/threonine-protein kinase HipA
MPRRPVHRPLRVFINGQLVGFFLKDPGGTVAFGYDESWLARDKAIPVSLSLPLREDPFKGPAVAAFFENLLPDSETLRRRVSEKVGAEGMDAYSLLSRIGRDCVGALQFLPEDEELQGSTEIQGRVASDSEIEGMLLNLAQAPLGLERERDFRISIAGAQEKTALLRYKDQWWKPSGATPTTHILKKQMGTLPNGLDLSNSIENEFYCLRLLAAFGLPVNHAEISTFGKTKALVIERFDRRWTRDGRLLRLPQEDCCQALSVPPSRKYQNDGGPGISDILRLLKASDTPAEDQKRFLKALVVFFLIGATDGHAKNFSIFLGPLGRFRLTPLYDILSAQPSLALGQIHKKQMRLAMFAGTHRHYVVDRICGRHFAQTVDRVGLASGLAKEVMEEVATQAVAAKQELEESLPLDFPELIHRTIWDGIAARIGNLRL